MSFTVATYNILATAYIRPAWYPGVPPEYLQPVWRVPALVRHIEKLGADILCLQEVEPEVFAVLLKHLEPLGYQGFLEQKGQNKPEGCATFVRSSLFKVLASKRLEYHDGERGPDQNSGFVALILVLENDGNRLGLANTHIRWDKPGTPPDQQIGYRQVAELVKECQQLLPPSRDLILCGDFNRTPDSEVVNHLLRNAGFTFALEYRAHIPSAVANGRAQLIDYLFHTKGLRAQSFDPPLIEDGTKLPSEEQPSDHLALFTEFDWISEK